MGYLTNTGTGFLSDAITLVSNKKSYIIGRYTSVTLDIGPDNSGQRIYDDGGYIENYTCAALSLTGLRSIDSPTHAANSLFASAITDGAIIESVECFYDSYNELENIDIA